MHAISLSNRNFVFEIYQYLSMCVCVCECANHSGVCQHVLTQNNVCEFWHFNGSWISQAFPVWRDESGEDQNLLLCSLATKHRKSLWLELSLVLEFTTSSHPREPRLLMTYQEDITESHNSHAASEQRDDPGEWTFIFSPRCWRPPTPGLFCPGECLKPRFPPRRYLCSCSRPHSRGTPETRQARKPIKIASFHPSSDKKQGCWIDLPSSFLIRLHLIFHRVSFPEFL